MAGGTVLDFRRRAGWARALAEGHLDRIRSQARWARVRAAALGREIDTLARQFAEDDLVVRSGPRRGQKLGKAGRQARLKRLAILHRAYWQAMDMESHLRAILKSLEMPGLGAQEETRTPEIPSEEGSEEAKRWVRALLGVSAAAEREDD